MKKFLCALALMFMGTFCMQMEAHPIPVTLSDGTVVILESNDFPTLQALWDHVADLERKIEEKKAQPATNEEP